MGQILSERYEALEVVSSGGFGTVYKARDRALPRFVALKVLHGHLKYNEVSMKRFVQEAEALTRLHSPHTCVVYDFGTLDDEEQRPYLAMEFIDGISLERRLNAGAMPLEQALPLMQQMCKGINAAHELGIIHRDIKPANIMLVKQHNDDSEIVRIVDFGLAKSDSCGDGITRTGETMGTPQYMSPEQCRGINLDGRADIYSLGCVFFEMLTGERLFDGNSTFDVMNAQINEPPSFRQFTDVPQWVRNLVIRMVAKDPDDRFASLSEVLPILEGRQLVKPVRSKGAFRVSPPMILVAASVLALIGVGGVWSSYNSTQEQLRKDAERLMEQRRQQLSNKEASKTALGIYEPMSPTVFDDRALNELVSDGHHWSDLRLMDTRVTDKGLAALNKLADSLRAVNVSHTGITDEGVAQLPAGLAFLSANHTDTMHDAKCLGRFANLKALHVMMTSLTDEGVDEIAKMPNLEQLSLARTEVGDAALTKLTGLKRLHHLHLTDTPVTDAGVDSILQMPLQMLTIGNSRLTEAGLAKLAKHPTLEWVYVSGPKVTTAALAQFAEMPRLKMMWVDPQQVDEMALRKALPRTNVMNDSFLRQLAAKL